MYISIYNYISIYVYIYIYFLFSLFCTYVCFCMYVCIYIYILAHHFMLLSLYHFDLGVDSEGWWLSNLCHSCGFTYQQRVLKMFPGHGYLHSEDGVVRLWNLLLNLYIYTYIPSTYTYIYTKCWIRTKRNNSLTIHMTFHCWISPKILSIQTQFLYFF